MVCTIATTSVAKSAPAPPARSIAHDTYEQRDVALKIALPQIFSGDSPEQAIVRKVVAERSHLAGSLQHPVHRCRPYDAGVSASSALSGDGVSPAARLEPYTRPDT